MTSPLRNFARLPGWLRRTDLSPWMRPCRTSCCASPATGEKGEEGFPTTLPTTRYARWSTRLPGMPAGASSVAALTLLEHADATAVRPTARSLEDRQILRFGGVRRQAHCQAKKKFDPAPGGILDQPAPKHRTQQRGGR